MKMLIAPLTGLLLVAATRGGDAQERRWPRLERYEPMRVPADNPMSEPKVELGRQLFYDKRLSGDLSRARVSCHRPEHGLSEGGTPMSGAYDGANTRSCPTLWNAGYQQAFYWEGAGRTLEQAISGVWRFNMAPGGPGRLGPSDVAARRRHGRRRDRQPPPRPRLARAGEAEPRGEAPDPGLPARAGGRLRRRTAAPAGGE